MKTVLVAMVLVLFLASCSTPAQISVDAEVKRMCAIDGGIKVYETVKLPAEKFDQWGYINFFRPAQKENALGPEYLFRSDEHYLRGGTRNPTEISMRRVHSQIVRRVDGKLLGEAVMYNRAGGDLPGPWMPSSYYCPDPIEASGTVLLVRIFTR